MRRTYITAGVIAVLTGIWFASGYITAGGGISEHPTLAELDARARADDRAPTRVRARVIRAVARLERVTVRGRTQNKRTVEVRAETIGRVVARPVERGARVAAGALLCRIGMEDRQARKTEAEAAVDLAELEYKGRLRLQDGGFQSETAIAEARARLASARARLEAVALDIERTRVRAPFDGVVEQTLAEVGDYAVSGTPCARIADLDPMLLVGQVSEREMSRLALGAEATGRLATGEVVAGTLDFIGRQADPDTRTYGIEVTVANPDYAVSSGITAEIDIVVGELAAHNISPALLALDDEGRLGVRTVAGDRVRFHRVEIVADDGDGVWVTGLPGVSTLITVGQELVVAGERVIVVMEEDARL